MSKATIERRAVSILYDFQKARKVWQDLVSDGLTQANALVNVQLQQGYVDHAGYWPPALEGFSDLKQRFESKLQKKADGMVLDFEITFTKMSAQYTKMKLQSSQFEYLMEEATESFGEAFTFREPIGSTCTLEKIWIHLERVFGLYTLQIGLNREIMEKLVARNLNPKLASLSTFSSSSSSSMTLPDTSIPAGNGAHTTLEQEMMERQKVGREEEEEEECIDGTGILPMRRDKDQGMILLSAWLNQPHLDTEVIATFDEFCQIELLGTE